MPREIRIGDVYRVRDDIEDYAVFSCHDDMIPLAGRIVTVSDIEGDRSIVVRIREDNGMFSWGTNDLVPITELRVGDMVRVRENLSNERPVFGLGEGMEDYEGDLVTISRVSEDEITRGGDPATAYFIEEDEEEFYWGFEDFVITAEREETIDRVAVVSAVWKHFKEKF